MYPLHKYMPTPFGTYLLYIDNGPTKVKVDNWPPKDNQKNLPPYQRVKEYGRRHQQPQGGVVKYQAFQKPVKASTAEPQVVHRQRNQQTTINDAERKKQAYSSTSAMPTSIWSPKVKRKRPSYNMRYLWHSGQSVMDPPVGIVQVDRVTGAEVKPEAQWFRGRHSRKHEDMLACPPWTKEDASDQHKEPSMFQRTEDFLKARAQLMHEGGQVANAFPDKSRKVKSRSRVPPNTANISREMKESYNRRSRSSIRNDMVPHMQRNSKNIGRNTANQRDRRESNRRGQNKETQTTPERFSKTCMNNSESSKFPLIGVGDAASPHRSASVPMEQRISPTIQDRMRSSRNCVQRTGLPPIMEGEGPNSETNRMPKTVAVDLDATMNRVRRVQEFRSASPTFPIASKPDYWEKLTMERGIRMGKSGNDSLLPFAWKEQTKRQERFNTNQDLESLLPMVTRIPSVPRVDPWKA